MCCRNGKAKPTPSASLKKSGPDCDKKTVAAEQGFVPASKLVNYPSSKVAPTTRAFLEKGPVKVASFCNKLDFGLPESVVKRKVPMKTIDLTAHALSSGNNERPHDLVDILDNATQEVQAVNPSQYHAKTVGHTSMADILNKDIFEETSSDYRISDPDRTDNPPPLKSVSQRQADSWNCVSIESSDIDASARIRKRLRLSVPQGFSLQDVVPAALSKQISTTIGFDCKPESPLFLEETSDGEPYVCDWDAIGLSVAVPEQHAFTSSPDFLRPSQIVSILGGDLINVRQPLGQTMRADNIVFPYVERKTNITDSGITKKDSVSHTRDRVDNLVRLPDSLAFLEGCVEFEPNREADSTDCGVPTCADRDNAGLKAGDTVQPLSTPPTRSNDSRQHTGATFGGFVHTVPQRNRSLPPPLHSITNSVAMETKELGMYVPLNSDILNSIYSTNW